MGTPGAGWTRSFPCPEFLRASSLATDLDVAHQGYELIAAGLLLIAGPVDGNQLLGAVLPGTSAVRVWRGTTGAASPSLR